MTEPRDPDQGTPDPLGWWQSAGEGDGQGDGQAGSDDGRPDSPDLPPPGPAATGTSSTPGPPLSASSSVPSWGTAPPPSRRPNDHPGTLFGAPTPRPAGTTPPPVVKKGGRVTGRGFGVLAGVAVFGVIAAIVNGSGNEDSAVPDPTFTVIDGAPASWERPEPEMLPEPGPLPLAWDATLGGEISSSLDGGSGQDSQIVLGEQVWAVGLGGDLDPVRTLMGLDAGSGAEVWRANLTGALCADEDGYAEILCLDAPAGAFDVQGGQSEEISLVSVDLATGATSSFPVELPAVRSIHRTDLGLLVYSVRPQASEALVSEALVSLLSPTGQILWSHALQAGEWGTTISESEVPVLSWLDLPEPLDAAGPAVAIVTPGAYLGIDPTTGPLSAPVPCAALATEGSAFFCREHIDATGTGSYDVAGNHRWGAEDADLVFQLDGPAFPIATAAGGAAGDGEGEPLVMHWEVGEVLDSSGALWSSADDPDLELLSVGTPAVPVLAEWWEPDGVTRITELDELGLPWWSLTIGEELLRPVSTLTVDDIDLAVIQLEESVLLVERPSGVTMAAYEPTYRTLLAAPDGVAAVSASGVARLTFR